VLPDRGLAFELISTYVGHAGVLTPSRTWRSADRPRIVDQHAEPAEQSNRSGDPRGCEYDHAHRLLTQLAALGHRPCVQIDERTFTALERVE
jgi:hypothetical protein